MVIIRAKLKDNLTTPRGNFRLLVTHRDGRTEVIEDHNMVVDSGRNLLALLLAGQSSDPITQVAIGNGSDPEQAEDTQLTNQVNVPISEATVENNIAKFSALVDFDTANGMDIHEFALVSTGGTLFSQRMRQASLVKSDDIQISIEWTVTL